MSSALFVAKHTVFQCGLIKIRATSPKGFWEATTLWENCFFFFFSPFCSFPIISRIFQRQQMLPMIGIYICSSEDKGVFQKSVTGAGPSCPAVQVFQVGNFNTHGLNRTLNFAKAWCSSGFLSPGYKSSGGFSLSDLFCWLNYLSRQGFKSTSNS